MAIYSVKTYVSPRGTNCGAKSAWNAATASLDVPLDACDSMALQRLNFMDRAASTHIFACRNLIPKEASVGPRCAHSSARTESPVTLPQQDCVDHRKRASSLLHFQHRWSSTPTRHTCPAESKLETFLDWRLGATKKRQTSSSPFLVILLRCSVKTCAPEARPSNHGADLCPVPFSTHLATAADRSTAGPEVHRKSYEIATEARNHAARGLS